jgi:hypothetical protein
MKLITNDMLKDACPEQRHIFRKEWPNGAPVTIEAAMRAIELRLDISWLSRLLQEDLLAEYQQQRAPLLAEYQQQRAFLGAEYHQQIARILIPLFCKQKD